LIRDFKFKIDWLLLFLILLPTFYLVNRDLREVQNNFFQISAMVLVGVMHVNRYIGLMLLWAIFQFIFFKEIPIKSIYIQNLFFGAIIYQFVVKFTDPTHLKRYFWVFYGVLMLNILWCFLQMAQIDPIFQI